MTTGFGTASISRSTFTGNSAGAGGGVASNGPLTIDTSTVASNRASTGGGIYIGGGSAQIERTTIFGNSVTQDGGGVNYGGGYYSFGTPPVLRNVTIADNTAGTSGGAVANTGYIGSMTLEYATLAANSAPSGAAIANTGFSGHVTLRSSIVSSADTSCIGPISDGGYNIEAGDTCGLSAANNSRPSTSRQLDPTGLQDNGGQTKTIALVAGSPAVDAIPSGANGCGTTIQSDQRGVSRPTGAACDIGAFEFVVRTQTVQIDIRPGEVPNPINLAGRGTVPVALLSASDFNAPADVATSSLKFGRTGTESSLALCSGAEDVNSDGLSDLVCHSMMRATGFQSGDTEGILTGELLDGTPIRGTDSIAIVPAG